MDKKLSKQYGAEILSYRLRSEREKQRSRKADLDKYLIALHREWKQLQVQRRNLGWEPLVPPVQQGWERSFVLRDDVARSAKADFYAGILERINTTEWSWKKDFTRRKRRRGRKIYVLRLQKLKEPMRWEFFKLFPCEKERALFDEVFYWDHHGSLTSIGYRFSEPWRFVLQVRPHIIDRKRRIDGELESRIREIDSFLKSRNLEGRMARLVSGRYQDHYGKGLVREKEKYAFRNKSFSQVLDLIKGES